MTDARFPERWLNDRRIMRLPDDVFKTFVLSLAWSAANRTDGWLHEADLTMIPGAGREHAAHLVAAELWDEHANCWLINDFDETQTTSAELAHMAGMRRKARDKKRRQRAAGAGRDVPDGVPRDITRPGQARPGSSKLQGQGGCACA